MLKLNKKTVVKNLGLIFIGVLIMSVVWVYASPTSTFYIAGGLYPSATSFTIFREGGDYFAKNGWGQVVYESSNATLVINYCLGSNRIIYMKQATYVLTQNYPSIELKDLVNIQIIGEEGTIWLKDEPSGYTGQLLEIDGCSNVIIRGIIFDQDKDNPDHLINPSLGLQWIVRVVGGSNHTQFYNCQFINAVQNNFVTGVCRDLLIKDSLLDYAGEHILYLSGSVDIVVDNCDLLNWGKVQRGYLKIDHSQGVVIKNCRLEMNEDGAGYNSSSYGFVIGSYANATTLRNNHYVDLVRNAIEGDYCTVIGGTFERVSLTQIDDAITVWTSANFTTIEDVEFINWVTRCIRVDDSSDTMIKGCYFSGGVTYFTSNFGTRTSLIENRWNPDTTNGAYGFYDTTGSGIVYGNHIPNSTLTFLFPSGAINGTNFFY